MSEHVVGTEGRSLISAESRVALSEAGPCM